MSKSKIKNEERLIKLMPYPNSSSLRFGGSYCKDNLLLLRTLIEATDKLESEERNSEFPKKLFETWSGIWLTENKENESYKSKQTMRDFFSFGYHAGIWNNDFELTDLAKAKLKEYNKDGKKNINVFKCFFDVLLSNFIVSYQYKTYNPLLLLLEGLEESQNKKINTKYIKEVFYKKLGCSLENWKSRMLYLLLSSSNYFEEDNKNSLNLKEDIEILRSKCNDKYHDKDIYEIQQDIDDQTKKSLFLTTGKAYKKKEKDKTISFKRIPNEKNQVIFFGAAGVGKSYLLNSKIKNIFGENYGNNIKRLWLDKNSSFEKLFWQEKEDGSIKLGFVLTFLIKAILNPNEYFVLIIEDIGYYNYFDAFKEFFSLFDRDETGFSIYPMKVNGEISKEIITLILKEITKLKEGDEKDKINQFINEFLDINLSTIKLKTKTEELEEVIETEGLEEYSEKPINFQISFPPNFYIWSTLNSFDNWSKPFNNYFKRRWDFQYIDINNNDEMIKEFKFKLNFGNESNPKETSVSWNEFRKKINNFISSNLELSENKLMGTFFISMDSLNNCKDSKNKINEDKLTEIIKNKVLFYLYDDIASSNLWSVFNKNYASNFSSLITNFPKYGVKVFSENLKNEIEKIIIKK